MSVRRFRSFDAFATARPTALAPDILWLDETGRPCRVEATSTLAAEAPIERATPCRRGPKWKDMPSRHGRYPFKQTGDYLWVESLYEETALTELDYAYSITKVSTQAFCIVFSDGRRHYPDVFTVHSNGSRHVWDIRPPDKIDQKAAAVFADSAAVCSLVGWAHHVYQRDIYHDAADQQRAINLRSLTCYGAVDNAPSSPHRSVIRNALAHRTQLGIARSKLEPEVPPHEIYHLMWTRAIEFDLTKPISDSTTLTWIAE